MDKTAGVGKVFFEYADFRSGIAEDLAVDQKFPVGGNQSLHGDADAQNLAGTVAALPTREDIDLQVQENMIVEYYSR